MNILSSPAPLLPRLLYLFFECVPNHLLKLEGETNPERLGSERQTEGFGHGRDAVCVWGGAEGMTRWASCGRLLIRLSVTGPSPQTLFPWTPKSLSPLHGSIEVTTWMCHITLCHMCVTSVNNGKDLLTHLCFFFFLLQYKLLDKRS